MHGNLALLRAACRASRKWVRAWFQYLWRLRRIAVVKCCGTPGALSNVTLRNIDRSDGAQHALLWIANDPKRELDIQSAAAKLMRGTRR